MKINNKGMTLLTAIAIGAVCAFSATAQTQFLHGHVPAIVSLLRPIGRMPATTNLQLAVSLPLRNQAALTSLLQQIYDPGSTNYQHYLTPEQFTAQFGPTEGDYLAVIAFAEANGLVVTGVSSNRVLLDVSGSVANIENAFHVTMQVYQHPTEPRTFFAPNVEPSVPTSVPILDISGINNYDIPRPNYVPRAANAALPSLGSAPDGSGGYFGKDFRAAYAPGISLNGSGQTISLVEFDGYFLSDIQNYAYYAGLGGLSINPTLTLNTFLLDGFSGTPGANNVEVALDIEMAIAMAPYLSKVNVYEGVSPNDVLNKIATDDSAKQISCSWNGFPNLSSTEQIFQQFEAQGQSFFNSSADHDAYTGTMNLYPADSPNVTSVGGTTLTTSGPGGTWQSETVWNWGTSNPSGGDWGSSGGISTSFTIPSWQQGISMAANQGSTIMRNFPDVALTADNVFVFADDGEYGNEGGTSCAAPLWAGFTALINQQAAANGQPVVGFLNPTLYLIGLSSSYASTFHDITTGNNEWPSSPTKFSAVSGYDLGTGWGTPNGQFLNLFLPSWNFTVGPLNTAREYHTATLMPGGQVFVTGGYNSASGYLGSSELYTPATGKWTTTYPLDARANHTATLLNSGGGLVLVAGGESSSGYLNNVEVYTTSGASETGSLNTPRAYHTATLLNNGQVLVTGGKNSSGYLNSCELFNLNTRKWTFTAPLNTARYGHTATLLSNGEVLVTGGASSTGVFNSAEIYNPAGSGSWSYTTSPMHTARVFHTATMLPNGEVLVAGGTGITGPLNGAELYNPAGSGSWTTIGSMNTGRTFHSATLLPNGEVLVAGGNLGYILNSAELYNPAIGTWSVTSSLNTAREFHTATLLPNGQVLAAGGDGNSGILPSSELYVP